MQLIGLFSFKFWNVRLSACPCMVFCIFAFFVKAPRDPVLMNRLKKAICLKIHGDTTDVPLYWSWRFRSFRQWKSRIASAQSTCSLRVQQSCSVSRQGTSCRHFRFLAKQSHVTGGLWFRSDMNACKPWIHNTPNHWIISWILILIEKKHDEIKFSGRSFRSSRQ